MSFVPLSEGSSVDLDDGRFGESVGTDEFVVGGMVGNDNDTDFASDTLRAPGEVAGVDTESTVFCVSPSSTDKMDALRADPGVRGLTTFLEGSVNL